MNHRIASGALAAAAVAVVVAGCGSSKKTSASLTSVTTETASSSSPYYPSQVKAATTATHPTTTASARSSTHAAAPSGATVTVGSATVGSLGHILVNGQGHTLYMFEPDARSKVSCTGSCAGVWPPLKLPPGATPKATGEVKQSLLGSLPDPEGGRVVTYNGWPLYTYLPDSGPGMATGQAISQFGGFWYVLSPSGQIVK